MENTIQEIRQLQEQFLKQEEEVQYDISTDELLEQFKKLTDERSTLEAGIKCAELHLKQKTYKLQERFESEGIKSITKQKELAKQEVIPAQLLLVPLKQKREEFDNIIWRVKYVLEARIYDSL